MMKLSSLSKNIPQFTWDEVRVSSDGLAADPGRYLLCTRGSRGVTKLFDKIGPGRVEVVWSMWRAGDGVGAHRVGGGGSDPGDIRVRPACETRPVRTLSIA